MKIRFCSTGNLKFIRERRNAIIAVAVVVILFLVGVSTYRKINQLSMQSNPYNDILANLERSQVERVSILVTNPKREAELSEGETAELITLLNEVEFSAVPTRAYREITGAPAFHEFYIKLRDDTEFVFGTNGLYYIISPNIESFYMQDSTYPSDREDPEGYPIDINHPVYQDILAMWNSLRDQYFPE